MISDHTSYDTALDHWQPRPLEDALLEACKAALDWIAVVLASNSTVTFTSNDDDVIAQLRAVIARDEGEG